MTQTTQLKCACGQTCLEVQGAPIASVECCCTSCREGAERIQSLEGAPQILTDYDATPYVMYRKDRVQIVSGSDQLREFYLTPEAKTRRVVATCCNTLVFVEFAQGHWLSIYAGLWPEGARPDLQMRTMAADLSEGTTLPSDVPNAGKHSVSFMVKLLAAWVAMGFRVPKVPVFDRLDT